MIVKFSIPGKPFSKERPRFTTRGKFVTTYTAPKTVAAEENIQLIARPLFKETHLGAVELIVVAKFKPAKSWSKKKVAENMGKPHLQKPDADNILKLVKDALNSIAYRDDSQVYYAVVQKRWAEVSETIVTVKLV